MTYTLHLRTKLQIGEMMKIKLGKFAGVGLVVLLFAQQGKTAPLGNKPTLSLEAARGIVVAAEKAATDNHWAMTIAILDDGGNLLCLDRMDDANLASVTISQQKAHTAVIFKAPSKVFSDALAKGATAMVKLDAFPFEGGIPIVVDGKVVGAIGVSGGDLAEYDGKVAKAGLDWLSANTSRSK
jgi:glc operon protein GlcG